MKQINMDEDLYDYWIKIGLREHPVLNELREETAKLSLASMQVSPLEGQFLQFLIRVIQAKKVLELGTFTGYSALTMALALPEDGKLITLDLNKTWTDIALPFWEKAGVQSKIELRLGQALDSLHNLLEEGLKQTFDFIFIDADKANYLNYYELALDLITKNGIIAIDNIFWAGKVIDDKDNSSQTREIRRLSAFVQQDERVNISLLNIADGLLLVTPRN